jgi:hypothetical protein
MQYAGEIRSRGMAERLERVQDDAPFAVCVLLRRDWEASALHQQSTSTADCIGGLPAAAEALRLTPRRVTTRRRPGSRLCPDSQEDA